MPTLIDAGVIEATPIVYEDFLPRSAAGIFQSNLVGGGAMANGRNGSAYGIDWLEHTLGCAVQSPKSCTRRRAIARCAPAPDAGP